MKDNTRASIKKTVMRALDISVMPSYKKMTAELIGNSKLNIHGCIKILKYQSENIILKCAGCTVSVCGDSLVCLSCLAGNVCIEGNIKNFAFCEEDICDI